MVLGDLGYGFVSFPAPAECRSAGNETDENYNYYPFHQFNCVIPYKDAKLTFYAYDSNILEEKSYLYTIKYHRL